MKISVLKTERRLDTANLRGLKIQSFGKGNDQPQRVAEIVAASVTGSSCWRNYAKFIEGRGFAQKDFYKAVVDGRGTTMDGLLRAVAEDYALQGGFAVHVNYNAAGEIVSASHFPVEWIRFEQLDENFRFVRLASHPDWGRRYTALRPFRQSDVEWFYPFNPDPEEVFREVAEAGGWNGYRGQILYFSNNGPTVYPSPIFAAALTDMSAEEGLSNITYRNVRHNFLTAGMLIDHDNTAQSEGQEEKVREELKAFQGDMEAGNILYINLQNGEEPPEFVTFSGHSSDKDFEKAEDKTPQIIGRAFQQPPILRSEDVGGNFGQDTMKNAYDYYNSITEPERMTVSEVFRRVFTRWHDPGINPDLNFDILPREYRVTATLAERLGDSTDKVLDLVFDAGRTAESKEAVLKAVYGLDDDEIYKLLTATGNAYNG